MSERSFHTPLPLTLDVRVPAGDFSYKIVNIA